MLPNTQFNRKVKTSLKNKLWSIEAILHQLPPKSWSNKGAPKALLCSILIQTATQFPHARRLLEFLQWHESQRKVQIDLKSNTQCNFTRGLTFLPSCHYTLLNSQRKKK